jgi:hypothetical protein
VAGRNLQFLKESDFCAIIIILFLANYSILIYIDYRQGKKEIKSDNERSNPPRRGGGTPAHCTIHNEEENAFTNFFHLRIPHQLDELKTAF